MIELKKKIRKCTKCGKTFRGMSAIGIGSSEKNKILFLGQNPWVTNGDFDLNKGRGIKILLKYLSEWGVDGFLDNVVKCQMPEGIKINRIHIENCREYLKKQIEILAPRYIILFGRFTAEAMGYKYTPWTEVKKFEISIVPHYSSFLYPGGENEKTYYQKLKRILLQKYKQMRLF